jgi:hypothetical protein
MFSTPLATTERLRFAKARLSPGDLEGSPIKVVFLGMLSLSVVCQPAPVGTADGGRLGRFAVKSSFES